MKKNLVLLALFGSLVFLTVGCAAPGSYGAAHPGGAPPSILFTSVSYPADNTSSTEYHIQRKDFEIVGPVEGRGRSHNILGLFATGESGYGKCLAVAKAQGGDDIINLRIDLNYTYILLGIYTSVESVVSGTAIKWKK